MELKGLSILFWLPNTSETLDKPVKLKALLEQEPYAAAIRACGLDGAAAFHWELEFPEVFFGDAGLRADSGFDAIIGNPPYDVLSERETGRDLSALQGFIRSRPIYAPSLVGKNNLYKLFICRALSLLADSGLLGFITPMAVLGDEQASGIRRAILAAGAFIAIEAFPQKDDPDRRVFHDAKLSTAILIVRKTERADERALPFTSRVHPADQIEEGSPALRLSALSIPLYDPENFTIISASEADFGLASRIVSSERMRRLKEYVSFSQGEVNETVARERGHLVEAGEGGRLVARGANICMYVMRPASQGTDLHLSVERFLEGKSEDSKAYHHRYRRVGLQESCPQNNFRRLIASLIPAGEFCNHKINYAAEHRTTLPIEFLLALLNSKLSDWYFRLGSTNGAVSHYQLNNLPCPTFSDAVTEADRRVQDQAIGVVRAGRPAEAADLLAAGLAHPPFSPAVRETVIEAVQGNRVWVCRPPRVARVGRMRHLP